MCRLDDLIGRIESETLDKGEVIPKEGVIVVDSIEEFMRSNQAVHLKDLDEKLKCCRMVSDFNISGHAFCLNDLTLLL